MQESSRLPGISDLAAPFMEKYHSQIEQEAKLNREKAAANGCLVLSDKIKIRMADYTSVSEIA